MPYKVPKKPEKQPTKAELLKKFKLDPRTEDEQVEDGIRIVVSGIRDELMYYFKRNDFARIRSSEVSMRSMDRSLRYRYERREYENAQEQQMRLTSFGNLSIANLRHAPEKLELRLACLNRSDEMQQVLRDVTKFMDMYLKAVEVVMDNSRTTMDYRQGDDRKTFIKIATKGLQKSSEPRDEIEDLEDELQIQYRNLRNSGLSHTAAYQYVRSLSAARRMSERMNETVVRPEFYATSAPATWTAESVTSFTGDSPRLRRPTVIDPSMWNL